MWERRRAGQTLARGFVSAVVEAVRNVDSVSASVVSVSLYMCSGACQVGDITSIAAVHHISVVPPTLGRYVFIVLPDIQRQLTLAEVQVCAFCFFLIRLQPHTLAINLRSILPAHTCVLDVFSLLQTRQFLFESSFDTHLCRSAR